ncbi:GNAT family N-acetyltransferase [Sedimentitalea sp. XS_ASV28]|uniref:GNAT family N-acetyltransferase n=1 Tax=Sedimentitalea sp. XS_ASV28 TaxID=3241296 RepID=UPI003513449D
MIRSVPNINTARLTLRAMKPEDFNRFAQIWATIDTVSNIGSRPLSRGAAWESFLRNAGHWEMTGFGQWAVIEQKARIMVGQTGFFFSACAFGEDYDPFPEAAWMLTPETREGDLVREAAEAAHDWFDRVIPGPLVARVGVENTAALRLAARLGYEEMRETECGGESIVLLRRNGPPSAA